MHGACTRRATSLDGTPQPIPVHLGARPVLRYSKLLESCLHLYRETLAIAYGLAHPTFSPNCAVAYEGGRMTTTILHVSDLHFGDPNAALNREDVNRVIGSLLAKAGPDALLVLSGDISFKGKKQGYAEAQGALHPALEASGIRRDRIIVCPGNHDVVKSTTGLSPFEAFDAWSADLRNDKRCAFSAASCRLVSCHGADFLVINSAYHGDTEYGLVDLPQLDTVLAGMDAARVEGSPRVAVLHHHLIPFSGHGDKSTTRNAYQVLTRLNKHGFSLVLHGHQHALLELGMGSGSMKLCGVGSFRYITPGFINGASLYRVNEQNHVSANHYAISKDAPNFLRAFTDF